MSAGLPVIVSKTCGCATDLVADGVTGFQFDPYDEAALTRLLLKMADPTFERATMVKAARARIAEWSPTRFATNFWRAAETAAESGPQFPRISSRLLLAALAS